MEKKQGELTQLISQIEGSELSAMIPISPLMPPVQEEPPVIIKKCEHTVHIVRKFNPKILSFMRKKFFTFLNKGKKELNEKLGQWQNVFDEVEDDLNDLAEQLQTFETKVGNIETQFKRIAKQPLLVKNAIEVTTNQNKQSEVNMQAPVAD